MFLFAPGFEKFTAWFDDFVFSSSHFKAVLGSCGRAFKESALLVYFFPVGSCGAGSKSDCIWPAITAGRPGRLLKFCVMSPVLSTIQGYFSTVARLNDFPKSTFIDFISVLFFPYGSSDFPTVSEATDQGPPADQALSAAHNSAMVAILLCLTDAPCTLRVVESRKQVTSTI